MGNSYLTVEFPADDSFEVKRSKFIGYVSPVTTEAEANAFIAEIKRRHWDAKHNVYAYILREGGIKRYSDDGEPQGTAGVPVLDVLEKSGVTDLCVVVTRYFGGILLGGGGLVRAYSHGASIALAAGNIVKMELFTKCVTRCDYTFYGRLPSLIADASGVVENSEFETDVKVTYFIPSDSVKGFKANLTEASNGRVSLETEGEEFKKAQ